MKKIQENMEIIRTEVQEEPYKSGTVQYMDSREVAEIIGKEHKNLIRDIRRYSTELTKLNFESSDSNQLNFEPIQFFLESIYEDSHGRKYPCYLVTKKGCEFIAHKLTGIKGTKFTATYINRFHEMESKLRSSETVGMTGADVEAIVEKVIEKLSGKTQRDIFIENKSVYEECSKNLYHDIDAYLIEMRKQELYKNVEAIANYYDFDCSYVLHIAYKELERKLGISLNAYKSVYKSETGKNNVCMVEVIIANDRIYKEAMGLTRYIIEKMEEFE